MAVKYVWSGATGTGDGSSWTNAYTTLLAAVAGGLGNYDTIVVAHDHDETTAGAITYNASGNAGRKILCVNRLGSVPPTPADLTTGAVIRTTGNSDINIAIGGLYFRGIRFKPGDNGGAATPGDIRTSVNLRTVTFDRCIIDLSGNTDASSHMGQASGGIIRLKETQFKFGAAGQRINFESSGANLVWTSDTGLAVLASGSVVPTNLIGPPYGGTVDLQGLDLTGMGTNQLIRTGYGRTRFVGCKVAAGAVFGPASMLNLHEFIEVIDCDSGAGGLRNERYSVEGQQYYDTATYLDGGASARGVPFSWRLRTEYWTAMNEFGSSLEGAVYNTVVGSPRTLTWEFLSNNTLTDAELFVEVDYPGDANSPLLHKVSNAGLNGLFDLAGTAHPASTAAWTNPGSLTTKQKMSVTFTPQRVGPIRWRAFYGRPQDGSYSIVHFDPQPTLT